MGGQDDEMQGRELRRWPDMRYEITRFDESIREASVPVWRWRNGQRKISLQFTALGKRSAANVLNAGTASYSSV
jgi:hypothetical protein